MLQEIKMTDQEQIEFYSKIDKKKIIEMLIECNHQLDNSRGQIERVVMLDRSERPFGGWVSVKDDLPDYIEDCDYSKNVLTTDGKNIYIMARCYLEDANGWMWAIADSIDGDAEIDDDYSFITHWQSIPKPPKL